MTSTLERLVGQDPISLVWIKPPELAIKQNAGDVTLAQACALAVNAAATTAMHQLTGNPAYLTATGMASEKAGFVAWEAIKAAREDGGTFAERFRAQWPSLVTNLTGDVLGHDPAQAAATYYLLQNDWHPLVASVGGFALALPVAAAVKTLAGEALHRRFKRLSEQSNVTWERYFEARFLFDEFSLASDAFEAVTAKYALGNDRVTLYDDHYHDNRLPVFTNRLGHVRSRTQSYNGTAHQSVEFNFTLPQSQFENNNQHNIVYVRKEKGALAVVSPDALPIEIRKLIKPDPTRVVFQRFVRFDADIRVALDRLEFTNGEVLGMLELKGYTTDGNFLPAAHYIRHQGHNILTDYSKRQLVDRFNAHLQKPRLAR